MWIDMCTGICINMCTAMCVAICIDMCVDMCIDMRVNMCIEMSMHSGTSIVLYIAMCADICIAMPPILCMAKCTVMHVDMHLDVCSRVASSREYAPREKFPSISKNVWCLGVNPTLSRSLCFPPTRRHFWQDVARKATGSLCPRKTSWWPTVC